MKAHIICCNDSVELAVIGSERKAFIKIEELADAHYEKTKSFWRSKKQYRKRCYWHFHTVEVC